jgi:hypothetical protein
MPREVGACLHFAMLNEAELHPASRFELVCAAKETVQAGGKEEPAFRYEARRFGTVTNRWWITADDRLVRAEFSGPTAELTTRADALSGLPAGVSKEY